jgi:hypothetical protein
VSGPFTDDDVRLVIDALAAQPRKRRLARDVAAFLAHVPTGEDEPAIHRADLMRLMGVDRSRVAYVALWVRTYLPQIGDALVSGPFGYRRTLDEPRVVTFRRHKLGDCRTRILITKRVSEPVLREMERSPDCTDTVRRQIAMTRLSLDRVIQDLDVLLI